MSQLSDYECLAETPNVRPKFSNVPFFPDIMIFWNLRVSSNFSSGSFFGFHGFPQFPGTLNFSDVPLLPDVITPNVRIYDYDCAGRLGCAGCQGCAGCAGCP